MYLEFPIPFLFPGFLQMDFSDIPALVGGFALGPIAGVFIGLIKNLFHIMTKSDTAWVGPTANFLTGAALVVPASIIYRYIHTKKGALIGLLVGTLSMTVIMAFANYYIFLPLYETILGFPKEAIVGMGTEVNSRITDLKTLIIYGTAPFNFMKGIAVSILTLALYKHISRLFKRI
jgi:riboflavin transporter FmnP